jgi:mono/diheme cytochrome c family protein
LGWLVSTDTSQPKVSSAFAAVAMPNRGSGGIWGAGGPAVDAQGSVYVVTGSGFGGFQDSTHDWTQSVLKLSQPGARGFALQGSYTPFNYCRTAKMDIDLGAGGALLLPDVRNTSPRLMAVGGKQGNVYLLDRDRLPGSLERRPVCSEDASQDGSLLAPQPQPQFGKRGPLNVFGPYSDEDAALDLARARSVPAAFRDARGAEFLFVTGNSKRAQGSSASVPPSVARLEVVRPAHGSPYLQVGKINKTLVLGNPGSPVVTSNGARNALVWILDENASRSAMLSGPGAPQPVLYALDAATLDILWRSAPGQLFTSGKYNEPAFGGGQVFVGTDRIQAFGAGGRKFEGRVEAVAPAPTPAPVQAAAPGLDGAAIFQQRCAVCHDNAEGNIPPRSLLAARSRERIIEALTVGIMRPQAQGLSAEQIEDVARYLKR